MRLTDVSIRALALPPKGQRTYFDDGLSNFGCRISQGGSRSFVVQLGADRQLVTIGRYPVISLAEAREIAKRLLAERTLGKFRPHSISWDEAVDLFLSTCEQKNKPRTVRDYRRILNRHFPFGHKRLSEITPQEINHRIDKLRKTPSEQNHTIATIKIFFRWAARRRYVDRSPCEGLQTMKRPARRRTLADWELAAVYRAAGELGYPFGSIVQLCILTGQRRTEIASLRRSYLVRDTVTLPPSLTKNNREHTVPLGIMAKAIICKAPNFDDLVFARTGQRVFSDWAPDRLARNSIDGGWIVYLLDIGTIRDLKFATYTFENNSQGKFMLQIMFGQSKYYSDALSENVRRGNKTKLEKGWRPNHAPLGYRNDPVTRTIVKDQDRFHLIRRMFEEILAGTPVSRVRKMANDEWNFRTPVRKRLGGKPITLSWVYKVLRNPFYAGLIPWNGKIYPGAHEPLVTMDEFERAQALIQKRGKAKPKTKEFAFTGMMHCGECGMLVTAEDKVNRFGSRYVYYHCTKRRSDYRCRQRCIRVEQLERQIETFLETLQMPEGVHAWVLARLDEQLQDSKSLREERRQSAEKSTADTERAIANLTTLRVHEHISHEEFVTERQKLEREQLRLKQLLTHDKTDATFEPLRVLISFSDTALKCFRTGDARTKRLILSSLGSNLLLKDRTLSIEAKKPLRTLANLSDTTQLRRAVDDIGRLYAARDPELMSMLDKIRKLQETEYRQAR